MMIILVIKVADPQLDAFHELDSHPIVWIGDKCSKVIDIVRWFIKVFDRY